MNKTSGLLSEQTEFLYTLIHRTLLLVGVSSSGSPQMAAPSDASFWTSWIFRYDSSYVPFIHWQLFLHPFPEFSKLALKPRKLQFTEEEEIRSYSAPGVGVADCKINSKELRLYFFCQWNYFIYSNCVSKEGRETPGIKMVENFHLKLRYFLSRVVK